MAITLTGFAKAFQKNIGLIAKQNDPQLKLTPTGFLRMLIEHNAVVEINNIEALRKKGQKIPIEVRYLQRGLESEVSDTPSCDTPSRADWKETTIEHNLYSQIGLFIPDDEFRQYEEEATQTIALGDAQQVPLMRGFYEVLLTKLIPLIGKIDRNLIAAQATKWGRNAAYESDVTIPTIKFGKSAELNNGYVKLLSDAVTNEVNGDLLVCGSGIITSYDIYHKLKTGTDSEGVNALPLNSYYDPRTNAWGKDHFGVFAKGCVGFVDWNKNVGAYSGNKSGHEFFTIPVPVELDGRLISLTFDAHLFYDACPEDGQPGYHLIVGKHYGLFNMPTDSFATGDDLAGVTGSFIYKAETTEEA